MTRLPEARERVRLTLETAPSEVPAAVRLRRLLKQLGRAYGWRCVEVEALPPKEAPAREPVREGEEG